MDIDSWTQRQLRTSTNWRTYVANLMISCSHGEHLCQKVIDGQMLNTHQQTSMQLKCVPSTTTSDTSLIDPFWNTLFSQSHTICNALSLQQPSLLSDCPVWRTQQALLLVVLCLSCQSIWTKQLRYASKLPSKAQTLLIGSATESQWPMSLAHAMSMLVTIALRFVLDISAELSPFLAIR